MSGTATELLEMLAKDRGLAPAKIDASSRLLQDLGMDGDDAVDFFLSLQERFGTDLTALQGRWSDHFGPEGFSCWNGLIIMPAAVIGGVSAGLFGLGAVGGIIITVALLALWLWMMKTWGSPDRLQPITVAQVIAAVEAGAWPRRD
jgi:acyl carrier protein